MIFKKTLARIDAQNELYLRSVPAHERDQMLIASQTFRGTLRWVLTERKRQRIQARLLAAAERTNEEYRRKNS